MTLAQFETTRVNTMSSLKEVAGSLRVAIIFTEYVPA